MVISENLLPDTEVELRVHRDSNSAENILMLRIRDQ